MSSFTGCETGLSSKGGSTAPRMRRWQRLLPTARGWTRRHNPLPKRFSFGATRASQERTALRPRACSPAIWLGIMAAMSRENLEIVRRGYEHFVATGELLPEIAHPDFVWDM